MIDSIQLRTVEELRKRREQIQKETIDKLFSQWKGFPRATGGVVLLMQYPSSGEGWFDHAA